ncbi:hypothetical protein BDZ85DRAFT_293879 [Elsinoe ampelina]|uniref:Uncharacterized protein n=1 Tax=Elsinoe ampelina TaxID=302913 RepID=A0A6A6GN24_9PEZI|nr:hypothetical protein BDZ85DRAFT_293879 [Elsinoe ampelina]
MCVLAPFLCSCSTLYEYLLECYRGFDNQLSEHLQFRQLEEIAPCAICQAVLAAEERLEWHFRCRATAQHGPLSQQRPDLPETSVEIRKTTRVLLKYDGRSNAPALPPLIDPMWVPRVVDSFNDHVWSKVEAAAQEQELMSSSSLLPDAELASMLFSDTRLLEAHVAIQESTAITTATSSRVRFSPPPPVPPSDGPSPTKPTTHTSKAPSSCPPRPLAPPQPSQPPPPAPPQTPTSPQAPTHPFSPNTGEPASPTHSPSSADHHQPTHRRANASAPASRSAPSPSRHIDPAWRPNRRSCRNISR